MRLSLVPQERRFFDLFKQQGQLVAESLTELSKSLLEGRSRHPRLRDLEHRCDDVTREIYELVNRTFVAPMEQEDILTLAGALDDGEALPVVRERLEDDVHVLVVSLVATIVAMGVIWFLFFS